MEWIKKLEAFFLKVENFFRKADFIAKLSKAAGVGMNAFNDSLMGRNKETLDAYINGRAKQQ